ncbi:hypothetical protein VP01_3935g2 [Puccinia sorghi]|uniref:Uncharacterized protein n=1 Tax=Puccinia sorghi TaxID=27349 RepID=A0A0L6UTC5_9BASI|nr:hypothetical protein VP01_3935g2 [Puccinia sorghi]
MTNQNASNSPNTVNLLARLLVKLSNTQRTSHEYCFETPLLSPTNECQIEGYIHFLGINNKEDTLNILIVNGFTSHKVSKALGVLQSDVREFGLTLGVVTVLFDNMAKYENYLCGLL